MGELEACVAQNLWPLEQCGPPFRALRALRPLLFLDTASLANSPLLLELPAATALHYLYSCAPVGLLSPVSRAELSASQVCMIYSLGRMNMKLPNVFPCFVIISARY